jgi:polysaccharide pyruvyl transferase WcaK-like protein
MKRVLVLGYYYKNNIGDDIFEYVLTQNVFKNVDVHLTIKNFDDLSSICTHETDLYDCLVIGGGELINEYYFSAENITLLRKYFQNIPVLFYGIGLSFPNMLPVLDIGDYFFMRNKTDTDSVKARYTSYNAMYTPDLAYYLLENSKFLQNIQTSQTIAISQQIGVCIPQTWFCDSNKDTTAFKQQIADTIIALSKNYKVHVIPFDTSSSNNNSDIVLANSLKNLLKDHEYDEQMTQRIHYVELSTDDKIQKMIECFAALDFIVASRFHSVILSLLTKKPFVSIYTQRKIQTLKNDLPPTLHPLFVAANVDQDGIPLSFDKSAFDHAVSYIQEKYNDIVKCEAEYNGRSLIALKRAKTKLLNIIGSGEYTCRYTPPQYISQTEKDELISKTIVNVLRSIDKMSLKNKNMVENNFPLSKILTRRKQASTGHVEKQITEEILWTITDDPYAPYYYGLFDSVLDSGLPKRLGWVIDDYYEKYKFKTINSQSITVMNKNFQELHRSGWQFIVDNLVMELNTKAGGDKAIILDTYVDKTFHWNKQFYARKGMIPYTQEWIGFIHHTYSYYNNYYNCDVLFKDKDFISSLENCKCLVVMSKYMKRQVQQSIQNLIDNNMLSNNVNVESVMHPTEQIEEVFEWDAFMQQEDKKVVQIGNWLRNVHAVYQIELPSNSIIKSKAVLKNKNTENYFPPPGFLDTLFNTFNTKGRSLVLNNVLDICKISFENMHVKGLYEYIVDKEKSVEEIEYVTNDNYDTLLAQNIVFINLVDASAVNTIVECVIRNTPIIVNPIEPVVEVLGPNYPLYFTSNFEASKILENTERIRSAHEYLKKMDKTPFLISTFMKNMRTILDPEFD